LWTFFFFLRRANRHRFDEALASFTAFEKSWRVFWVSVPFLSTAAQDVHETAPSASCTVVVLSGRGGPPKPRKTHVPLKKKKKQKHAAEEE
jgi:hypothetical protein